MLYREVSERLATYRRDIAALREKMRALQNEAEPEEVENYRFATADGPVRLSELFGGKEHLFVIHNMGKSCPACTMWADGFNGVLPHLENRAAFVVSSPDDPETQRAFAASRGWRFRMVSHQGTSFAADMGYRGETGLAARRLGIPPRRRQDLSRLRCVVRRRRRFLHGLSPVRSAAGRRCRLAAQIRVLRKGL